MEASGEVLTVKSGNRGLRTFRQTKQIVQDRCIPRGLQVLSPLGSLGDNDVRRLTASTYIKLPFSRLDSRNRIGLGEFPSRAVCILPTDMGDRLMPTRPISFIDASNLVS